MSQDNKEEGFFITAEDVQTETSVETSSKSHNWSHIARLNWIAMVISLILVFGVDLSIIIGSPDLAGFWFMMLGVLGAFAVFFWLENFVFKKMFLNTNSKIDAGFVALVLLRNITFVLNFIPFIQILGLVIAGAGIVPYLIIYLIAVYFRMKKVKANP